MNTREAIQNYLGEHPFSYADELSQALSKTRANIQHHLKGMEADGIIMRVSQASQAADRGRPRAYYSLSAHEKPDNILSLADALLRFFLKDQTEAAVHPDRLAVLARAILPPKSPASASASRLNYLAKELSARKYQARWEAHASGPEIIFRSCPYAALIEKHPELCQMDVNVLNLNLGTKVRQISKIQLPTTPACRFIIDSIKT